MNNQNPNNIPTDQIVTVLSNVAKKVQDVGKKAIEKV